MAIYLFFSNLRAEKQTKSHTKQHKSSFFFSDTTIFNKKYDYFCKH